MVFIYENMHDVAGQVMALDIAGPIMKMDMAIFGVEPTLWAQKIYSPLLTDIMAFSYAIYFALPLFIMFLMSLWGKRLSSATWRLRWPSVSYSDFSVTFFFHVHHRDIS